MTFFTTFRYRIWTRNVLHLKLNGRIMLAENLLSRILTFWHRVDSNKETNLSNDHNGNNTINSSNYKSLIKLSFSTIQLLKRLRSNHSRQIIIGHLNIISIRNKFGIMKPKWLRYFYGYRNKIRLFLSSFTI